MNPEDTLPFGSRLLEPLVLTQDEAELLLAALEGLLDNSGPVYAPDAELWERAVNQLYDKIKEAK